MNTQAHTHKSHIKVNVIRVRINGFVNNLFSKQLWKIERLVSLCLLDCRLDCDEEDEKNILESLRHFIQTIF